MGLRQRTVVLCIGWLVASGLTGSALGQNSAPVVSNVIAGQRNDNSKLVDIRYNLTDADGDACTVWIGVSDDGGSTWKVPVRTLSGNWGGNIAPGNNKLITWDAGFDIPGRVASFRVRVWADDGKGPAPMVVVPGGEFRYQNANPPIYLGAFLIDKYEVTNALYCQFLNNADPTSNYFTTSNTEITRHGTSGNYYYTVQPGKENYPVRYVSWNDATAFAQWRTQLEGVPYRLPTEEEWEKAAAWNPAQQIYWTYAFQRNTIDCTWCNYDPGTDCVGNTTPVGHYNGTGGRNDAKSYYGCYDMSGNVWEWTNSWYTVNQYRVIRGGSWNVNATYAACSYRTYSTPSARNISNGFRLVLDPN